MTFDYSQLLLRDASAIRDACRHFNAIDEELYVNAVSNADAEDFLVKNIPTLTCSWPTLEEIWYFRWWSFRKHLRNTPFGRVIIEFLPDVQWAGAFNTINCPAEHQLREARWYRDQEIAKEYAQFWVNPETGAAPRSYTFGAASAAQAVIDATGDQTLAQKMYLNLKENMRLWEAEKQRPNGMFFQIDDRDGMEVSIGGNGFRSIINATMVKEYATLAQMADRLGRQDDAALFADKSARLRLQLEANLWNPDMQFFMTRREEDFSFVNVRELHGYAPWYAIPDLDPKYDAAWKQLCDPQGFAAPFGPTTAEQRHPGFRLDRNGHACQWNGPSWPHATSTTLTALANLLHNHRSDDVSRHDWFNTFSCYLNSHFIRLNGTVIPWIDENLHPYTGEWLSRALITSNPKRQLPRERGKDYSHSTFADLVITQLVGLRPEEPGIVLDPMLPANALEYFLINDIPFRGHDLAVLYDHDGSAFGADPGLSLFCDRKLIAHRPDLGPLEA